MNWNDDFNWDSDADSCTQTDTNVNLDFDGVVSYGVKLDKDAALKGIKALKCSGGRL